MKLSQEQRQVIEEVAVKRRLGLGEAAREILNMGIKTMQGEV